MINPDSGPRRGEIWTAPLGNPPVRHWVLVVSIDSRNLSSRIDSVLIIPFGSQGVESPTTLLLPPGESGLPGPSWLKGHYVSVLGKRDLGERLPRRLSQTRMRQVSLAIRRAFDPDAPVQ